MQDGHDPIEKMSRLRNWLVDNKLDTAPRPLKTTGEIRITDQHAKPGLAASKEIAEFENWINEIQSPVVKPWFSQ